MARLSEHQCQKQAPSPFWCRPASIARGHHPSSVWRSKEFQNFAHGHGGAHLQNFCPAIGSAQHWPPIAHHRHSHSHRFSHTQRPQSRDQTMIAAAHYTTLPPPSHMHPHPHALPSTTPSRPSPLSLSLSLSFFVILHGCRRWKSMGVRAGGHTASVAMKHCSVTTAESVKRRPDHAHGQ